MHASENDRSIPGTGHVDWDGLFRGLSQIGYDGRMRAPAARRSGRTPAAIPARSAAP